MLGLYLDWWSPQNFTWTVGTEKIRMKLFLCGYQAEQLCTKCTISVLQVFVMLSIILVIPNLTARGLEFNIDAPDDSSISTAKSPESCVCFATDSVEVEVSTVFSSKNFYVVASEISQRNKCLSFCNTFTLTNLELDDDDSRSSKCRTKFRLCASDWASIDHYCIMKIAIHGRLHDICHICGWS